MKTKIYYHVRAANGCTIHWMERRGDALALARKERCSVFMVFPHTGRALLIYAGCG